MNQYIDQFKKEPKDYAAKCGYDDSETVLDLLWYCYSSSNPIDDGLIKEKDAALAPVFNGFSVNASDALTNLICELCSAYQRAALLEGIQIGFCLGSGQGVTP